MTSVDFTTTRTRIALFQLQFLRAIAGDDAFDEVAADLHDHVRHDVADLNLFDLTGQLIPR